MEKRSLSIDMWEYASHSELDASDQELVKSAQDAMERAYAPYSNFNVGAAVRLANGVVVQGNNQENAAYPSGLCAERVAIFYANSLYPDVAVVALAVCASRKKVMVEMTVPPCGACRQVMLETETRFNQPIRIILAGTQRATVFESAKTLLPLSFDSAWLED